MHPHRNCKGGWSSTTTWERLIASCDGLRFRHMDLRTDVGGASVLLEASAETLETLCFESWDNSISKLFGMSLPMDVN